MLLVMITSVNNLRFAGHNFIKVLLFSHSSLSICHLLPDINKLKQYENYLSFCINIENYNSKYNFHLLMDGTRIGSDYTNGAPIRRKKIQVTSTNKIESYKKQQYMQTNPYFLSRNPSTPFLQRTPTNPDNISNRDTLTQTSSQKSGKIIRTNGLTKAQKPNLSNSRSIHRTNLQKGNGVRVGPAFSSGFSQEPHVQLNYSSQQQYGIGIQNQNQTLKNTAYQNARLEQQNNILKQQNLRLREQMARIERNHKQQVKVLREQVDRIFRMVGQLEGRIIQQDKEWEKFCRQQQPR